MTMAGVTRRRRKGQPTVGEAVAAWGPWSRWRATKCLEGERWRVVATRSKSGAVQVCAWQEEGAERSWEYQAEASCFADVLNARGETPTPPSLGLFRAADGIVGAGSRGTKAKAREPAASADATERPSITRDAEQIEVEALERHPDNRVPTAEAIAERAESMGRLGQLEPILVRPLEMQLGSRRVAYQILSGETRWLAAKQLGWPLLLARVVECTDAQALVLLAEFNAQRKDLDPIERARLLARLMAPVAEGGAGLTSDAAAKIYGLESGGGVRNLVRLLELPEVWQERVARGELPQREARLLVPYAHVPQVMAAIEEKWDAKEQVWDSWMLQNRGLEYMLEHVARRSVRPVDKGVTHDYGQEHFQGESSPWSYTGARAMKFKLTPELEQELVIVELPLGPNGKAARFATNTAAYDALQIPLIKRDVDKRTRRGLGADADNEDPEPSGPAKKTAADLRRQREHNAFVLTQRIELWRHHLLRRVVAERVEAEGLNEKGSGPSVAVYKVLLWLTCNPWQTRHIGFHPAEHIARSAGDERNDAGPEEAYAAMALTTGRRAGVMSVHAADSAGIEIEGSLAGKMLAVVLGLLRFEPGDPKKPVVPAEVLEDLAADYAVDVEAVWRELHGDELAEVDLRLFFELHNCEQLDALGDELKVFLGDQKTKKAKLALLMTRAAERVLPCPKSLRPVELDGSQPKGKRKKGGLLDLARRRER